jgi:hypothetical protein
VPRTLGHDHAQNETGSQDDAGRRCKLPAFVVDRYGRPALQPATVCRARHATPQAALHLDFIGKFRGCDQPGFELRTFRSREVACDITRYEPGLLLERIAIKSLHE